LPAGDAIPPATRAIFAARIRPAAEDLVLARSLPGALVAAAR